MDGRVAPPEGEAPVVGVRYLNAYIGRVLVGKRALRNLGVRGEVSNLRRQPAGMLHFDLKEDDYILKCVAWSKDARTLPAFEDGMRLVAYGEVVAYERRSQFQLVVKRAAIDGVGDVHAQFLLLKKKLEAAGLFDPARKRAMPAFPFRIALVSSPRADGAIDFRSILHARSPHVRVHVCETAVQGPNAAFEIADAIDRAAKLDVDLIVVSRGGGSFEDLFPFSAEPVVRAIVRATHPVLSAIGHTADRQLSDFAADAYAETPSDAAARVSPETRELLLRTARAASDAERVARRIAGAELRAFASLVRHPLLAQPGRLFDGRRSHLAEVRRRASDRVRVGIERRRDRVQALASALERHNPTARLAARAARLAAAGSTLDERGRELVRRRAAHAARAEAALLPALRRRLEAKRRELARADAALEPAARRAVSSSLNRLAVTVARLDGRDPHAVLERGYAIVTYEDRAVRDPSAVPLGARVKARVARGTLLALVEAIETHGDQGIG